MIATLFAGGLAANAAAQVPAVPQTQSLNGSVQDARGLPLLGAFVAVVALGADQPTAIVVTDARGEFEVTHLQAGIYSLLVGSLGFAGTVMQGVNVPSAAPISLQLDEAGDRVLSAFDAPLELSWALRSSQRDVLRETETTLVGDAGDVVANDPGYWEPAGRASARNPGPLVGEFRLWSFTGAGDRETVGVTSLQLGSANSWGLTAHAGSGGTLWAGSHVTRDLGAGHELNVGFRYVGGSLGALLPGADDEEGRDSWIGRLEVRDRWQVFEPVSVTYGLSYEHHNYLADSSLISPALEVAITPRARMRVFTGVAYTAAGLDLIREDTSADVVSLLGGSSLRIGDTVDVSPQRTLRYHLGLEQGIGAAQVSLRAYYDDVTDELLGVYLTDSDGIGNYLLFNAGDTAARGFEFGLAAELIQSISGEITYSYRNRDTDYPMPGTEEIAAFDNDASWSTREMHEVQASVAAELLPSHTRLVASYNWRVGMPVIRDGVVSREYGRLDVRVRQHLPFRALHTEWSAMVQVRNVLGPDYDGLYNVSLAELMGLTRGIAGGLAVSF